MLKIQNKKIHDFIVMKDELVTKGRAITADIEAVEKKIKACENKEKEITGKIEPDPELKAEGDRLVGIFNETMKKIEEIGNKIEAKKMEAIPKELIDEHKEFLKEKEQLERERNKIALKVQKTKDRVIPIIQKEVKPHLKEYDDIETATVKDGEVLITTFNHLDDWKRKFKQRQG